jgi:copper transport protein
VTPLPLGAYRVQWHVVSADGHPVGGSFVFWVGDRTRSVPVSLAADDSTLNAAWGPSVARAPLIPALVRGAAVGVAMSLAGLLLFLAGPRDDAVSAAPRAERMTRCLVMVMPLLLVANATTWIMNASASHRLTSGDVAAALASDVGRLELWRIGLALLAAWAFLLARRPRIALGFAAAVIALSGATGHSAAIQPMLATPAKSLHLLGGAAWLGGLLWLLLFEHGDRGRYARQALRVSSVALWASAAVALSGILMSALFLSSPRDLIDSAYGAVVLAKVVGLLSLMGFGAYHRFRVLPALRVGATPSTLATTVKGELAIMVVVVLLGGLLAYVTPARPPGRSASPITAPVE